MAAPAYDGEKHHIGLGLAGDEAGWLLQGGYKKTVQPPPVRQDYGADNELTRSPAHARWTQNNFLGGGFFTVLTDDASIFRRSKNYLPSQQGYSLRSVPPMVLWDNELGGATPGDLLGVFSYNEFLYAVYEQRIVRTQISTGTRTEIAAVGAGNDYTAFAIDYTQFGTPVLWLARFGTNDNILRFSLASDGSIAALTTYDLPTAGSNPIVGMDFSGIVPIYVDNRGFLWIGDLSPTDATPPIYTETGTIGGQWMGSTLFNGFVYILVVDDNLKTSIVQTDGSTIQTLLEVPFSFAGRVIQTYGGRVYIGGNGKDVAGDDVFAEFYELTGTTLRPIREFHADYHLAAADLPVGLNSFAVFEGMLFLGASGEKLVAYDQQTDSLHGGPELPDTTLVVNHLLGVRDQLFAFCTHPTVSAETGWYRIAQAGDSITEYDSVLETVDFIAEPAYEKRWSEVHLLLRNSTGTVTVEYCQDGSTSFTSVPVVSEVVGTNVRAVADLSLAPVSRNIRLRFTVPRGDLTGFSELVAFTMTFSFIGAKHAWNFNVFVTDMYQVLDREGEVRTVEEQIEDFWAWMDGALPLGFIDLQGDEYRVLLRSLDEHHPSIADRDPDGKRDVILNATLVEA